MALFGVVRRHLLLPLFHCAALGTPKRPPRMMQGHLHMPLPILLWVITACPFPLYCTDMAHCHHHGLVPQGLFDIGHGTVLDSGTTFTYLPSQAFQHLHKQVSDYALSHGLHTVPGPDPSFHDTCFGGAPSFDESHKLGEVFPGLELYFQVSMLTICLQLRKCVCENRCLAGGLLFVPCGLCQRVHTSNRD